MPNLVPIVDPRFFGEEIEARKFAFACLRAACPDLVGKDLSEH